MLSRVAESIYWMSRQVERAENLARFLEVTLHLSLDQADYVVNPWEPLVLATGEQERFREAYPDASPENVVAFLGFDRDYQSSMLSCLWLARENARSVREVMSTEAFEILNEFYHFVSGNCDSQLHDPTAEFFDQVRQHAIMWSGVWENTMSRNDAWHFFNAGRLIERADKVSRILDVKYFGLLPRVEDVGTSVDDLQWSTLLLAISAFEAYRREHHLMDVKKVVGFFLFHQSFPRSIRSCIAGASWSLREIEKGAGAEVDGLAKGRILSLRHRLENSNAKEVIAGGMHEFIDRLQTELNDIDQLIAQDYFNAEAAV